MVVFNKLKYDISGRSYFLFSALFPSMANFTSYVKKKDKNYSCKVKISHDIRLILHLSTILITIINVN